MSGDIPLHCDQILGRGHLSRSDYASLVNSLWDLFKVLKREIFIGRCRSTNSCSRRRSVDLFSVVESNSRWPLSSSKSARSAHRDVRCPMNRRMHNTDNGGPILTSAMFTVKSPLRLINSLVPSSGSTNQTLRGTQHIELSDALLSDDREMRRQLDELTHDELICLLVCDRDRRVIFLD